jgi:hypothetical protein
LFFNFKTHGVEVQAQFLEDVDGDALAQFDEAQEKMLGADKIVVEPVGLLAGQRQNLLRPRREIVHRRFFTHSFTLRPLVAFVQRRAAAGGRLWV